MILKHMLKRDKELPNETFKNIFKYISHNFILLIGIFVSQRIDWLFIGGDSNLLYLYTFPLTVIIGLVIIFLFIWMNFKTVQLQCFNNSYWTWWLTYGVIALLLITLFMFLYRNHFSVWTIY